MQKQPKFHVGQKVKCPATLYGETVGVIVEVEKVYKVVSPYTGGFDPHGLVTCERTIKSIQLPYRFDGERLEVDYPQADMGSFILKAHTDVSLFYGYAYVVSTPKMRTQFNERSLKVF